MSNTIKITRPALAKILTESGVDKWKKGHNRWNHRAGWRISGKPGEPEWEIHLWSYSIFDNTAMEQDMDKIEAALTKAGIQWSRRTFTSPIRVQQIQAKD